MLSLKEGTDCKGRCFCCVNSDFKKILQFHEVLFFKCCLHYLWLWAHFLKSDLKWYSKTVTNGTQHNSHNFAYILKPFETCSEVLQKVSLLKD